jgi:hypothetical protein
MAWNNEGANTGMAILDIDGNDIAQLTDTDLRTLVGLLCEAELRKSGLPVSSITYGGKQEAADGGIDVRVSLDPNSPGTDFIPRPKTIFQVKQEKMPVKRIRKEMAPRGDLRPSLRALACESGAYVLVSGQDNVADPRWVARKKAIKEAFEGLPFSFDVAVDFYDRKRMATWVRGYPGLIAWVREKNGRPITGWSPFENWSAPNLKTDEPFLFDDLPRFEDIQGGVGNDSQPRELVTVLEGVERLREILDKDRGCARLVGLSGVGKTRLIQALFDRSVGENALDPVLVLYTDIAFSPNPLPLAMLRDLRGKNQRAIVVVDNCSPAEHAFLAKECTHRENKVSLLTVEYDVTEDQPEETRVFKLHAASGDLLEDLLAVRRPDLAVWDRCRIATLSGGNFRLALAMVRSMGAGESTSRLSDKDLFDRLFFQRNSPNDKRLLRTAEACALVYSFKVEPVDGEGAELPILTRIARQKIEDFFENIKELLRRGLIQRRGPWGALLPHALANRLAAQALECSLPGGISDCFRENASARLLKSFTRRLGYLHDCEAAMAIAKNWFSQDGYLGDPSRLNELGCSLFENLAPALPEEALKAIGRAVEGESGKAFCGLENRNRNKWINLLRKIAYDPPHFRGATMAMANFGAAEPLDRQTHAQGEFKKLFRVRFSGTYATIDQRLEVIKDLFRSQDLGKQRFAMEAFDGSLRSQFFHTSLDYEFGARQRSLGWEPSTQSEVAEWYGAGVIFASEIALSTSPLREKARELLARHFRELWIYGNIPEKLEKVCEVLIADEFWPEGWIAVRTTLRLLKEDADRVSRKKLESLEKLMKPKGLFEKVKAYLFSKAPDVLDVSDGEPIADGEDGKGILLREETIQQILENLGKEVAETLGALENLGQILFPDKLTFRGFSFGKGLATGAHDLRDVWERLVSYLPEANLERKNIEILKGFLHIASKSEAGVASEILDSSLRDPILGLRFPSLQAAIGFDADGLQRLEESLEIGLAPAWVYRDLAYGKTFISTPIRRFRKIIRKISTLTDGYEVAFEIFQARCLFEKNQGRKASRKELAACGIELLKTCPFDGLGADDSLDYALAEIAKDFLIGEGEREASREICIRLRETLSISRGRIWNYERFIAALFRLQPEVALNEFLGKSEKNVSAFTSFRDFSGIVSPFKEIEPEVLINWAIKDPGIRFRRLAMVPPMYEKMLSDDGELCGYEWMPHVLEILKVAPEKADILSELDERIFSQNADVLESYRKLMVPLLSWKDAVISEWAKNVDNRLKGTIEQLRKEDKMTRERFE